MKTNIAETISRLVDLIHEDNLATAKAQQTLGYENQETFSMAQISKIHELTKTEGEKLGFFVENLDEDEKRQICAIMLLGRGDFETYQESLKYCKTFPIETAAEYILGKTLKLEEYLRDGMAKL